LPARRPGFYRLPTHAPRKILEQQAQL